jgi:apolipoprotein D and lipocalin family protein
MRINKWYVALALGAIAINFSSCSSLPKGAVAVRPFDQQKYLGKWYEIARLDFKYEKNLNNVTAEYSLKEDGKPFMPLIMSSPSMKNTSMLWLRVRT